MELGLTPQDIASGLPELLEFSREVSLSKMSEYILAKRTEKKELEEEVMRLNKQIAMLKLEESNIVASRDAAFKRMNVCSSDLKSFTDLRKELK